MPRLAPPVSCPWLALALAAALCAFAAGVNAAPTLAFPDAEGCGALATGGRAGKVYTVTTLEDYAPKRDQPIAGSLRAAVEAEGPRVVVFAVSGLVELKAPLVVRNPRLTIAGQTAPGDGICLKNYNLTITADDVVVRYLRVRPGDVSKKQLDGLSVYQCRRVIVDHCSVSWSVDEVLSVTGEGCSDVTVQWCMITESLNNSVHAKGEHGYGSLVRVDGDVTYHHNVYAHHKTRCPRPGTYGAERGIWFDFRNNLIYDWGAAAGYTAEDRATLNYVGNYLKPGPSTKDRKHMFKIGGPATRMFVADNYLEGVSAANSDNWSLVANDAPAAHLQRPLALPAVRTDPPDTLYDKLLAEAGAVLPRRDPVDVRVVEQIRQGTGRLIDSQNDVGGWPQYTSSDAPLDSDGDGLPDAWENSHGLDPNNFADGALVAAGQEYTNLELYLNRHDRLAPH